MEGKASYDRRSGDFYANLLADHINLEGLPLPSPVSGVVSGYGMVEGNLLNGSIS